MSLKQKVLAKYFIVIASKRDDYLKMVNDEKIVDFVIKNKLNDNWAIWYLRCFKQDQKVFSPENQEKIKHFASMTHLANVTKVRFEKKHAFEDGLKLLDDAEKKSTEGKRFAPTPSSERSVHKKGKIFLDLGNGWAWWDLGVGKSKEERDAMGHCGNIPSYVAGDHIISLRHDVTKDLQEAHVTAIFHKGFIGEMKGKENYKPSTKYHAYILKLLEDKRIKGLVGGGYLPESNFQKEDILNPEDIKKLEKEKPNFFHPYVEDLPQNKFGEATEYVHSSAIRSATIIPANATKEQIDRALEDKALDLRKEAIKHSNATKEQIDRALKDEDADVRSAAIRNPNATKEHIDKALKDEDADVRRAAIRNPNATKEHIDKALKDKNVRNAAISNPNATKEHIDKALKDEVRRAAIEHPNATKEQIDRALKDKNVRSAAISNPNATKEQIDKALKDEDVYVRRAAISNPNATKEQIDRALKDSEYYVRNAAISNSNVTKDHIDTALKDKYENVRYAAIEHPNATKDHIDTALKDEDAAVRSAAIQHPNITKEHAENIFKNTGMLASSLLKTMPTKTLINIINKPTEETKDEITSANAETAMIVLKQRRKDEYEKALPTMTDDDVIKYSQSVDKEVRNKANKEWQRRKKG
jgi:hypothetical protein